MTNLRIGPAHPNANRLERLLFVTAVSCAHALGASSCGSGSSIIAHDAGVGNGGAPGPMDADTTDHGGSGGAAGRGTGGASGAAAVNVSCSGMLLPPMAPVRLEAMLQCSGQSTANPADGFINLICDQVRVVGAPGPRAAVSCTVAPFGGVVPNLFSVDSQGVSAIRLPFDGNRAFAVRNGAGATFAVIADTEVNRAPIRWYGPIGASAATEVAVMPSARDTLRPVDATVTGNGRAVIATALSGTSTTENSFALVGQAAAGWQEMTRVSLPLTANVWTGTVVALDDQGAAHLLTWDGSTQLRDYGVGGSSRPVLTLTASYESVVKAVKPSGRVAVSVDGPDGIHVVTETTGGSFTNLLIPNSQPGGSSCPYSVTMVNGACPGPCSVVGDFSARGTHALARLADGSLLLAFIVRHVDSQATYVRDCGEACVMCKAMPQDKSRSELVLARVPAGATATPAIVWRRSVPHLEPYTWSIDMDVFDARVHLVLAITPYVAYFAFDTADL